MSEYQYYEFLALDRPLNAAALEYVRSLSSRVRPTTSHAVFTYSYGNFRGKPLDLLAKHYDMLLHLANWGTRQVAFRFPKTAIDQAMLQPYYYGIEEVELTTVGDYLIFNINFPGEGDDGWIEEEDRLAPLAPLRDDIMRGDLRSLYLVWLASASQWFGSDEDAAGYDDADDDDDPNEVDEQDDLIEPPVPAGLGQLSAPLQAFANFFRIDRNLLAAAAQGSQAMQVTNEPIEHWITLLSETERNTLLVRAARGEAISGELLQRLRQVGGVTQPAASGAERRTFSAIQQHADAIRQQRQTSEKRAAERARIARLEALESRAEAVWAALPALLAQRNAGGYEQAVAHLVELRDLAIHRGQLSAFDERMRNTIAQFTTSQALLKRLKDRKLL